MKKYHITEKLRIQNIIFMFAGLTVRIVRSWLSFPPLSLYHPLHTHTHMCMWVCVWVWKRARHRERPADRVTTNLFITVQTLFWSDSNFNWWVNENTSQRRTDHRLSQFLHILSPFHLEGWPSITDCTSSAGDFSPDRTQITSACRELCELCSEQ